MFQKLICGQPIQSRGLKPVTLFFILCSVLAASLPAQDALTPTPIQTPWPAPYQTAIALSRSAQSMALARSFAAADEDCCSGVPLQTLHQFTLDGRAQCSDHVPLLKTDNFKTVSLGPGCYRFSSFNCYSPVGDPVWPWTGFSWGFVQSDGTPGPPQDTPQDAPFPTCAIGNHHACFSTSIPVQLYFVILDQPCGDNTDVLGVLIEGDLSIPTPVPTALPAWPQHQQGQDRQGYAPGQGFALPLAAPFFDSTFNETLDLEPGLDASSIAGPVIAENMAFVGTASGRIYGVDLPLGGVPAAKRWSRRLDGPVLSYPAVANAWVLASTGAGTAWVLDAVSGAVLFRWKLQGNTQGPLGLTRRDNGHWVASCLTADGRFQLWDLSDSVAGQVPVRLTEFQVQGGAYSPGGATAWSTDGGLGAVALDWLGRLERTWLAWTGTVSGGVLDQGPRGCPASALATTDRIYVAYDSGDLRTYRLDGTPWQAYRAAGVEWKGLAWDAVHGILLASGHLGGQGHLFSFDQALGLLQDRSLADLPLSAPAVQGSHVFVVGAGAAAQLWQWELPDLTAPLGQVLGASAESAGLALANFQAVVALSPARLAWLHQEPLESDFNGLKVYQIPDTDPAPGELGWLSIVWPPAVGVGPITYLLERSLPTAADPAPKPVTLYDGDAMGYVEKFPILAQQGAVYELTAYDAYGIPSYTQPFTILLDPAGPPPTVTPTLSYTPSPSSTVSPSASVTPTPSPSASFSHSPSISPTQTPVLSPTVSSTSTATITASPTRSPQVGGASATPTEAPTRRPTRTSTITVTLTHSPSLTASPTSSPSFSHTRSWTNSPTRTRTLTRTSTLSRTRTASFSPTPSPSATATRSASPTASPTALPCDPLLVLSGNGGGRFPGDFNRALFDNDVGAAGWIPQPLASYSVQAYAFGRAAYELQVYFVSGYYSDQAGSDATGTLTVEVFNISTGRWEVRFRNRTGPNAVVNVSAQAVMVKGRQFYQVLQSHRYALPGLPAGGYRVTFTFGAPPLSINEVYIRGCNNVPWPTLTPPFSRTFSPTPSGSPTRSASPTDSATPSASPTRSSSATPVLSATPTATLSSTSTISATTTATATVTPGVLLYADCQPTGNCGASTLALHPWLRLQARADGAAVDLATLSLRYWFSSEGAGSLQLVGPANDPVRRDGQGLVQSSLVSRSQIQLALISVAKPAYLGAQDMVVELRFAVPTGTYLPAGQSLDLDFSLLATGMAAQDQSNDWSWTAGKLQWWDQVSVYADTRLIWGREPSLEPSTFTATPTATVTPTASVTVTPSVTRTFTPYLSPTITPYPGMGLCFKEDWSGYQVGESVYGGSRNWIPLWTDTTFVPRIVRFDPWGGLNALKFSEVSGASNWIQRYPGETRRPMVVNIRTANEGLQTLDIHLLTDPNGSNQEYMVRFVVASPLSPGGRPAFAKLLIFKSAGIYRSTVISDDFSAEFQGQDDLITIELTLTEIKAYFNGRLKAQMEDTEFTAGAGLGVWSDLSNRVIGEISQWSPHCQ